MGRNMGMRPRLAVWAVVAAAATLLSVGITAPAASAATVAAPTVTTVQAPMNVVCSTLTDQGRQWLQENHISACGVIARGAQPNLTGYASGNCGSSSISATNQGGGKVKYQWGFSVKSGVAVERDLTVEWYNDHTSKEGSIIDLFPMASATYTSKPYIETTGSGEAGGQLSGTVYIAGNYVTCAIGVPFVNIAVS